MWSTRLLSSTLTIARNTVSKARLAATPLRATSVGSATMGLLYDRRVMALVVFGMVAQLVAAVMFFRLRGPLAEAAAPA